MWLFLLLLRRPARAFRADHARLPTAFRSLRHTAATLFIASGTDVGTVAGLLGHSQPSTTLDIYTHAFDKNKKAASQIMQSSLEI